MAVFGRIKEVNKDLVDNLKKKLLGEKWKSSDEKFLSLTLNSLRVLRYDDDGSLMNKNNIDSLHTYVSNRITVVTNKDHIVKDVYYG